MAIDNVARGLAICAMKNVINTIYPIGHILMTENSSNPNTYLGVGTWVQYGAGKVPVGIDSTQTEFDTIGKTGGEKAHKLTDVEMQHAHNINTRGYSDYKNNDLQGTTDVISVKNVTATAHNNLQPYIVCYMWKRTE